MKDAFGNKISKTLKLREEDSYTHTHKTPAKKHTKGSANVGLTQTEEIPLQWKVEDDPT